MKKETKKADYTIFIKVAKRVRLTPFILIIVIACVLSSYVAFKDNVEKNLENQTTNHLTDLTDETASNANSKIGECFSLLKSLSYIVADYKDIQSDDMMKVLNKQVENDVFTDFAIVESNGNGLWNNGKKENLADESYIKKTLDGKNSVSEVYVSDNKAESYVIFSVPIIKDDEVRGALICKNSINKLSSILEISSFGQSGNTFIMQKDGTLVTKAGNTSEKVIDVSDLFPRDDNPTSAIISCIKSKETGNVSYGTGKNKKYICFSKLSYNDWYVVSIVTANSVETQYTNIINNGVVMSVEITLVCFLLIAYLIWIQRKYNKNNKINDEHFKMLTKQSESVVFEYNCKSNKGYCSERWKEIFGRECIWPDTVEELKIGVNAYSKDSDKVLYMAELFESGRDFVEAEIRILNKYEKPVWCKVKANAIRSRRGNLLRIMGTVSNIDAQKREIEYFKEMARLDAITGLYNKESANYKIERYLSRRGLGEVGALAYIDIDNFKQTNDNNGHYFGDKVIKDVGAILKKVTNENIFAARYGGDEFLIFIRDTINEEKVKDILNQILELAKEYSYEDNQYKISLSIGVAMIPKNGTTSAELLQNADKALYEAKDLGKNRIVFSKNN